MPEYWEKRLFEDTKQMLDSGSTDFLTGDELKFADRLADRMFLDFVRDVPELDMEAAGTLSDFVNRSKSGDIPKTRQEISDFRQTLDRLGLSPGLSDEYRQHVQHLSQRLQNYEGTLDTPVIDRFGAFKNRKPGPIQDNIRKSGFNNFIQPDIDGLIQNVREEAKTKPFAASITEETKQAILDDLIATFDANGQDSSWLRELKDANFFISFHDTNDGKSKVGGQAFQQDDGFVISMNVRDYPNYSNAMKTRLLHELRHVWQHQQDKWKPKFGDGINTRTDLDVEVDAYENQILLEKIFGIESNTGKTFKAIEATASKTNEPTSRAAIIRRKANALLNSNKDDKLKKNYRIKSLDEYEKEYPE